MTSDLLSLEQMFGATHRRLRQLSDGAPGPVANKATKVRERNKEKPTHMVKTDRTELDNTQNEGVFFFNFITSYQILRQFKALMGGSVHAPRQDTANSSHQATTNQLPTSTYSDPLRPAYSADNTNHNHYQPDIPPNYPSSPCGLALDQRDSSGELMNDGHEEKRSPNLRELLQNQVEPVKTAKFKFVAEESEPNADRSSSPPAEPQGGQPCPSKLSLFSGMELVTKGKPLCKRETSQTETDTMGYSLRENPAGHNSIGISETSDDAPLICNSVACDSSQPVSAFSFLNF